MSFEAFVDRSIPGLDRRNHHIVQGTLASAGHRLTHLMDQGLIVLF
jgi:hypothetical protein